MDKISPLTLKRIQKDLQNFNKNPPKGIAIVQPEPSKNPLKFLTNIKIQQGIYQGIQLHFDLLLSPNHPVEPPQMILKEGQNFNQQYHHHIYKNGNEGGYVMCIDVLDQKYIDSKQAGTGWSPSYGFVQLLIIIQQFLSDHDFHSYDNEELERKTILLKQQLIEYKCSYVIDGQIEEHSWEKPFPMYQNQEDLKELQTEQEQKQKQQKQKDKLDVSSFESLQDQSTQCQSFQDQKQEQIQQQQTDIDENTILTDVQLQILQSQEEQEEEEEEKCQDILKQNGLYEDYEDEEEEEEEKQQYQVQFNSQEREENQQIQNFTAFNYNLLQERMEDIQIQQQQLQQKENLIQQELILQQQNEETKQRLSCYVTGQNLLDDPEIILGYPILLKREGKMMDITPYTELLSYEGYMLYTMENGGQKLQDFETTYFKSATQQPFNYWLPIYLNKENFDKNYEIFKNSLTVLLFGNSKGTKEQDFHPRMIVEVLPNMINALTVNIVDQNNQSITINNRIIEAWCHLFRLLQEFQKRYDSVQQEIEHKIQQFMESDLKRSKTHTKNLGEFIILLALSRKTNIIKQDILEKLLREKFARNILWILKKMPKNQTVFDSKKEAVQFAFDTCRIGSILLVYNLEVVQWFYRDGFLEAMEGKYGLVEEEFVEQFVRRMKELDSKIVNYSEFFKYLGYGGEAIWGSDQNQFKMIESGVALSNHQGYTKVNIGFLSSSIRQNWGRKNWGEYIKPSEEVITENNSKKEENCWRSSKKRVELPKQKEEKVQNWRSEWKRGQTRNIAKTDQN